MKPPALRVVAHYLQSPYTAFLSPGGTRLRTGPQMQPWAPAWNVDMRSGLDAVPGHLTLAIEARRLAHEMGAVFCGRMPTAHAVIPGGFTGTPTAQRINAFRQYLNQLMAFIRNVYIPDVNLVASVYHDYYQVDAGYPNLLAFGVFDEGGGAKLLASGVVRDVLWYPFDAAAEQRIADAAQPLLRKEVHRLHARIRFKQRGSANATRKAARGHRDRR